MSFIKVNQFKILYLMSDINKWKITTICDRKKKKRKLYLFKLGRAH